MKTTYYIHTIPNLILPVASLFIYDRQYNLIGKIKIEWLVSYMNFKEEFNKVEGIMEVDELMDVLNELKYFADPKSVSATIRKVKINMGLNTGKPLKKQV